MARSWTLAITLTATLALAAVVPAEEIEYSLHATSKTSSMEKELNESGSKGYRLSSVMGGETSFGGNEVVAVMARPTGMTEGERYTYRLLATSKTSTMQKEMQQAADEGYRYSGQTVFNSTFGGDEVVIILERPGTPETVKDEYLLLATKKSSTLLKELQGAGSKGYELLGMTVSATSFGGNELVAIMRRPKAKAE